MRETFLSTKGRQSGLLSTTITEILIYMKEVNFSRNTHTVFNLCKFV